MSRTTVDHGLPHRVVCAVGLGPGGHHCDRRGYAKTARSNFLLTMMLLRAVAQPEKEKDMGTLRQRLRELVGAEPEHRIVARGMVPIKVGWATWMYVRPESPHNPSYAVESESASTVDEYEDLTTGETVSDAEIASEPVAEAEGLDDQQEAQSWIA